MPLVDGTGGIRNISLNIDPQLKTKIDIAVANFEAIVAGITKERGFRRAVVRSQLECSSVVMVDAEWVFVVAEVSKGMPSTHYIEITPSTGNTLYRALDIAKWDLGLDDGFGFMFPLELLDTTSHNREIYLHAVALQWVESEIERVTKEQQLVQINPIFGPASYVSRSDFCFMIGPFDEKPTEIYETIIKPTIENLGFVIHRANEIFSNKAIMTDIWKSLCEARVVIADLTTWNPNVCYELGIAHTLGKETILISKEGDRIPFDFAGIRHIRFNDSMASGPGFSDALRKTFISIVSPDVSS